MAGSLAGVPLVDFSGLADIGTIARQRREDRDAESLIGRFVDEQLGGQRSQSQSLAGLGNQFAIPNQPQQPQQVQRPQGPQNQLTVANAFSDIQAGQQPQNSMFADASAANQRRESGGNPNARNPIPGQSAGGLFGFIDSTFVNTLRRHMPERVRGLTDEQAAELKFDPEIAQSAERFLARDNARGLRNAGVPVNSGTIQLSHFLGAPDATRVLQSDPNTPLNQILSAEVMRVNPNLSGQTAGSLVNSFQGGQNASQQGRGGLPQVFQGQAPQSGENVSNDTIRALARNPQTRQFAIQFLQSRQQGRNPGFRLQELDDGTVLKIDQTSGEPSVLIAGQSPQDAPTPFTDEGKTTADIQNGFITPEQLEAMNTRVAAIIDDPEDLARIEGGLRKEFTALSDDFRKVRDSFGRVQTSVDNPSPAGDISLVFNFMKMLDPGSVVRESEFLLARNAASVPTRLRVAVEQLRTGEGLGPEQRADFAAQAGALFNVQQEQFGILSEQFGDVARRTGVRPGNVVVDFASTLAQPIRRYNPATDSLE